MYRHCSFEWRKYCGQICQAYEIPVTIRLQETTVGGTVRTFPGSSSRTVRDALPCNDRKEDVVVLLTLHDNRRSAGALPDLLQGAVGIRAAGVRSGI